MDNNIDVSIVIVSTNEKDHIEKLLPTLYETCRNISFEVILIDNASDDNLGAIKKKYSKNLTIIKNSKRESFSKNQNKGFSNALSQLVISLNPDVKFSNNEPCIPKLVNFMKINKTCGVSGCRVYNFDGSFAYPARKIQTIPIILARRFPLLFKSKNIINDYLYNNNDFLSTFECEWLSGCLLIFRNDVLKKIQGFDENYKKYFEDVDICYRINKIGWKVLYYGGTYYYHEEQRASMRLFSKDALIHLMSYFYWCKKRYFGF